jgi:hypothetical protein
MCHERRCGKNPTQAQRFVLVVAFYDVRSTQLRGGGNKITPLCTHLDNKKSNKIGKPKSRLRSTKQYLGGRHPDKIQDAVSQDQDYESLLIGQTFLQFCFRTVVKLPLNSYCKTAHRQTVLQYSQCFVAHGWNAEPTPTNYAYR